MARSSITRLSDDLEQPILILRAGSMSVPLEKTAVQEISRPGLDGHDYQQFGKKTSQFTVNCELDADTESRALEKVRFFESLQGNLVDYKDENARVWRDMIVLDVVAVFEFSPTLGFLYPKYDPFNPASTSQYRIQATIWMRNTRTTEET